MFRTLLSDTNSGLGGLRKFVLQHQPEAPARVLLDGYVNEEPSLALRVSVDQP